MERYLLLFSILFAGFGTSAQALRTENLFLGIEGGPGAIFKHSSQIEHISNANPSTFELHTRYVLPGDKFWQQKLGRTSAGLMFSFIEMGNPEILGNSYHLVTYLTFPIKSWQKLDFEFRLGIGMTYADNKFNLNNNRKNTLYSTDFSGLAYLRFALNYELSKRYILSTAMGLLHFSNGSYKLPNLGANVLTANLGLYYKLLDKDIYKSESPEYEKSDKKYLLNIGLGYGWKAAYPIREERYSVYSLMLQGEIRNRGIGSWLFGLDLNKNESLRDEQAFLYPNKDFENDYRAAVLGGYSLNIGRLSALGQLAFYVYSPVEAPRPFYQKIGLRFRMIDEFHLGLNLKAHGGVADFVEYVLTYKI